MVIEQPLAYVRVGAIELVHRRRVEDPIRVRVVVDAAVPVARENRVHLGLRVGLVQVGDHLARALTRADHGESPWARNAERGQVIEQPVAVPLPGSPGYPRRTRRL